MNGAPAPSGGLADEFRHQALLYASRDEFLAVTVPFIQAGLERGDAVLHVGTQTNLAAVRESLGHDAAGVAFGVAQEWYARPCQTLQRFYEYLREQVVVAHSGVRVIGEQIVVDRPPDEIRELGRCDAATNAVLAWPGVEVMCPYDARTVPPPVVDTLRRTHPSLIQHGTVQPSEQFMKPTDFLGQQDRELVLAEPSRAVAELPVPADPATARRFVARHASAAGLARDRVEDLVIAVSEVSTNALQHATMGRLRVWSADNRFVCEIRDHGPGLEDALAGYRPPREDLTAGRGLWLARQLADLVEVGTGEAGTAVRLHMDRLRGSSAATAPWSRDWE